MHKIIRIFVWVLAAIVILGAGLFAYLRSADLSVYQSQIESFVSSRIGHTLEIGGRFELQVGRTTTIVAEDFSLSNMERPENAELISVGNVEFSFNTWSLISQPFIIEELYAENIRAYLTRDETGKANWAAELPTQPNAESGQFDPNRIAFRAVNIQDIEFTYTDPNRPRRIYTSIDRLTISPDVNDILDLDIVGDINDLPLWADGKLGPWQNFIDGRDIFADLDLTLGPIRLSIDGTVADLKALQGVEFNGVLAGPDIARVLDRLALPPLAAGEFELIANVQQFDAGHQLRLDGNLGDIEVFVSGNRDSLMLPQEVAHDFSITGPDAHFVAELFGIDDIPAAPFQLSGDYARSGPELTFTNTTLSVGEYSVQFSGDIELNDRMPDWDVHVSAAGPEFSIFEPLVSVTGLPNDPFSVSGRISKSGRSIDAREVSMFVGDNTLTADGSIKLGESDRSQLVFHSKGPNIARLLSFAGLQGLPERPFDISARIESDPEGVRIQESVARFGANVMQAKGVVVIGPGLVGTNLEASLEGPELHNVALLTGVPYLPKGPFHAEGGVRFADDVLEFGDVVWNVGDMEGRTSGHIGVSSRAGELEVDAEVSGPDVSKLAAFEGLEPFVGESFKVVGDVSMIDKGYSTESLQVTIGGLQSEVSGTLFGANKLVDINVAARADDAAILRKVAKLSYVPEGPVVLNGKIEVSGTDVNLTDTRLSVGENQLTANGSLNLTPLKNDSDLEFNASGPSLAEIGRMLGNETLPDKTYSVSGKFHGTPSGFAVRNFLAQVGNNDLLGEFSADLRGKPQIVGSLVSTHLDIKDRTQIPDDNAPPMEVDLDESDAFVFPDERLEAGWLQAANLDIDLQIDELITNVMRVTDVRLGVQLQDGALSIDPIQLRDEFGGIAAEFELAPHSESYSLRALLNVDNLHAGLSTSQGQDRSTLPPISGQLELRGTGNSLRTIMASSNGSASFRQGSGKVKEMFGSAFFKDVLMQVLRTLNPMRRSRDFQILECGIYKISVEDGIATIENFVIQTDTMTTVARGTVNLGNERLDIAFRAKPREGIGISLGTVANQLLEVRGTLKSPRIRVDAGRTATTTGAAVATGGLSLLARGLWDRLSAEADICEDEN